MKLSTIVLFLFALFPAGLAFAGEDTPYPDPPSEKETKGMKHTSCMCIKAPCDCPILLKKEGPRPVKNEDDPEAINDEN